MTTSVSKLKTKGGEGVKRKKSLPVAHAVEDGAVGDRGEVSERLQGPVEGGYDRVSGKVDRHLQSNTNKSIKKVTLFQFLTPYPSRKSTK